MAVWSDGSKFGPTDHQERPKQVRPTVEKRIQAYSAIGGIGSAVEWDFYSVLILGSIQSQVNTITVKVRIISSFYSFISSLND